VPESTAVLAYQVDNVLDVRGAAPPQARASRLDHAAPRQIEPEEWRRFRGYIGEIFAALGMDLDTPGTRETPERFLRARSSTRRQATKVIPSS
jgi:GTP cyclohydrolase I